MINLTQTSNCYKIIKNILNCSFEEPVDLFTWSCFIIFLRAASEHHSIQRCFLASMLLYTVSLCHHIQFELIHNSGTVNVMPFAAVLWETRTRAFLCHSLFKLFICLCLYSALHLRIVMRILTVWVQKLSRRGVIVQLIKWSYVRQKQDIVVTRLQIM